MPQQAESISCTEYPGTSPQRRERRLHARDRLLVAMAMQQDVSTHILAEDRGDRRLFRREAREQLVE